MKLKKYGINLLLVELIGAITFLSVALVIIVSLFTSIYKFTSETKDLVVSTRAIQNVAEYCKGSGSKQECESVLDSLGKRVEASKGMAWEIGFDEMGEIQKGDKTLYLISVIMESESLIEGEWLTITLVATTRDKHQVGSIQRLEINKYERKRG